MGTPSDAEWLFLVKILLVVVHFDITDLKIGTRSSLTNAIEPSRYLSAGQLEYLLAS